jgi:hypothetical protein
MQLSGADLVMYVYDCTNSESLHALPAWQDKVRKANGNKKLPGILCIIEKKNVYIIDIILHKRCPYIDKE